MPAALQVIQDSRHAATVLQPERLRLLELLAEPDSASGLARKLGEPRQKVHYHLQQLEQDGFVELVEERRKGNCTERVLRATAKSYLIGPAVLGKLGIGPDEVRDRFSSAYLVSAAARLIRDVTTQRSRADRAKKRLATLSIEIEVRFASAEARNAFTEELATEMARLAAKYHDAGAEHGRTFRFLAAGYPAITKHEEEDHNPVRME